jgi:hypothetical protein
MKPRRNVRENLFPLFVGKLFYYVRSTAPLSTNAFIRCLNSTYQYHPDTLSQPHSFPVPKYSVCLVQYAYQGRYMYVGDLGILL